MRRLILEQNERHVVTGLVSALTEEVSSVEDSDFLGRCQIYAHDLPERLRVAFNEFRLEESGGALSVRGFVIDDHLIGPTPEHWKNHTGRASTRPFEVYFMLCAALLGDAIGWATQQNGHVMHDIFPIKGHEMEQLGSGSEELLTWHTEEAFHPLRADYIGLACLRNPGRIATTFASVDDLKLSDDIRRLSREERYRIRPDRSHLPHNRGKVEFLSDNEKELINRSYEYITELDRNPEKVRILFGDPRSPYIRIDPYFMEQGISTNPESAIVMDAIKKEIDRNIHEYVLDPGEVIFLDNYKMVHGRVPFKANFDGTDRWLKRLNIVRDLRKSREYRLAGSARVIY